MVPIWFGFGVRDDLHDRDNLEGVRAVGVAVVRPWLAVEADGFVWTGFAPRVPTAPRTRGDIAEDRRDIAILGLLVDVATPWRARPEDADGDLRVRPCLQVGVEGGAVSVDLLYQSRYTIESRLVPRLGPVTMAAAELEVGEFVLRGAVGLRASPPAAPVATIDLMYRF